MIIWIASYPKSGNTWFRVFLANALRQNAAFVGINDLGVVKNFSARQVFDASLGWESADLSTEVIDSARIDVQEAMATDALQFFKVHESFRHPITNQQIFSSRCSVGAIYIVRNPLDVAVSFANHLGRTIAETITLMNRNDGHLRSNSQLPQAMGDWSWHVNSWTRAVGIKVFTMRYEDMLTSTERVFKSACDFAGLKISNAHFERALANSEFGILQQQEEMAGFKEAPQNCTFFRSGKQGDWRSILSKDQIASIVSRHREMMIQFGYLTSSGDIPVGEVEGKSV